MDPEDLIAEALRLPFNAIEFDVSQRLAACYPGKAIIQGGDGLFDVEEYACAGHCHLALSDAIHNDVITFWRRPRQAVPAWGPGGWYNSGAPPATWSVKGVRDRARNAWFEVRWQGHDLDVLVMRWSDMRFESYHYWIVADCRDVAEDFLIAVCAWNSEIRGEVLVYNGGCWRKDEDLYREIKGATFDNLVLRGDLKEHIRDDLAQFFASRELYERHGVPWKRGVLFVGPPGNGKTHAVKALLNAMAMPCLYVKSFRAEHRPDESCIGEVFERARAVAPCILVLEDLDALVTPHNRAYFLNELDGFAANVGIVALATTNHPERLDPAILERPSRFDRKYPFDLPALPERQAYIALWNGTLQPALRLSDEGAARIAAATDGFSFAYLKELFLSAMMRWIADPQPGTMESVMVGQVETLREQMTSAMLVPPPAPVDEGGMPRPQRIVVYGGPPMRG